MKERLMKIAKELFIKNGYNLTTTGEIVKKSGSSKGNLYHHFGTKENLFVEIIKNEEQKWFEVWKEKESECESNREKFMCINALTVNSDYYYPLQFAILEFYANETQSAETLEKINQMNDRFLDIFRTIFEEGNAEKEWKISDVELASKNAIASLTGIVMLSMHQAAEDRLEMVHHFSNVYLRGVDEA